MGKWIMDTAWSGNAPSLEYIVPDTTPFDIPEAPLPPPKEPSAGDAPIHPIQQGESPGLFYNTSFGLTKREWFAGMAMQGLLANLSSLRDGGFRDEEVATFSSQMADALIAALNKKEETK